MLKVKKSWLYDEVETGRLYALRDLVGGGLERDAAVLDRGAPDRFHTFSSRYGSSASRDFSQRRLVAPDDAARCCRIRSRP